MPIVQSIVTICLLYYVRTLSLVTFSSMFYNYFILASLPVNKSCVWTDLKMEFGTLWILVFPT